MFHYQPVADIIIAVVSWLWARELNRGCNCLFQLQSDRPAIEHAPVSFEYTSGTARVVCRATVVINIESEVVDNHGCPHITQSRVLRPISDMSIIPQRLLSGIWHMLRFYSIFIKVAQTFSIAERSLVSIPLDKCYGT